MQDSDRLKRKLRNLKKDEERMVCGLLGVQQISFPLIWNQYFDLNGSNRSKAKYTFNDLKKMSQDEFDEVVNDYFFSILEYFCRIRNHNICPILNIPNDSDISVIKKRFRELAKTMHPDAGGSQEDFIQLYEVYEQLMNNR